jgi:outer membrane cobalamin receptor
VNDTALLKELIKETILAEAGRKKKKGKRKSASKKRSSKKGNSKSSRRKSSAGGLSAKTKETLKKKADAKGYTAASVYAEYRAGLAAWLTGHRPGVSQHQWAMARVNSATPSKPWAKVKKKKN